MGSLLIRIGSGEEAWGGVALPRDRWEPRTPGLPLECDWSAPEGTAVARGPCVDQLCIKPGELKPDRPSSGLRGKSFGGKPAAREDG